MKCLEHAHIVAILGEGGAGGGQLPGDGVHGQRRPALVPGAERAAGRRGAGRDGAAGARGNGLHNCPVAADGTVKLGGCGMTRRCEDHTYAHINSTGGGGAGEVDGARGDRGAGARAAAAPPPRRCPGTRHLAPCARPCGPAARGTPRPRRALGQPWRGRPAAARPPASRRHRAAVAAEAPAAMPALRSRPRPRFLSLIPGLSPRRYGHDAATGVAPLAQPEPDSAGGAGRRGAHCRSGTLWRRRRCASDAAGVRSLPAPQRRNEHARDGAAKRDPGWRCARASLQEEAGGQPALRAMPATRATLAHYRQLRREDAASRRRSRGAPAPS